MTTIRDILTRYGVSPDRVPTHGDDATPIAVALSAYEQASRAAVWKRALSFAMGCVDYGGGYRGMEYDAYQAGIQTVVAVLRRAADGKDDHQLRVLEAIGRAAEESIRKPALDAIAGGGS